MVERFPQNKASRLKKTVSSRAAGAPAEARSGLVG